MSTLAIVVVVLASTGGVALALTLMQASNHAGPGEDPVGGWSSSHTASVPATTGPRELRSLLTAERTRWQQPGAWENLVARLNNLQIALGGPPSPPAPPSYSPKWLEERVTRIEALAGLPPGAPVPTEGQQ